MNKINWRWFLDDDLGAGVMIVTLLVVVIIALVLFIAHFWGGDSKAHYFYYHCDETVRLIGKVWETVWDCTDSAG